jgi:Mce-associated membrane protein
MAFSWVVGITDKEVAVPSFRRRASVTETDKAEESLKKLEDAPNNALALAEAEAAEAEAMAAGARARAQAIRLRREAEEAAAAESTNGVAAVVDGESEDESESAADNATAVAEASADEHEDLAPSGRRWGFIVKVVAMTLGILLTAALLTAGVLMFLEHRKALDAQRLNAEYAAAGRQSVVTLMSLNFNNAKEDVQRIIDNATGEFKTDFQNQAEDFIKVAQDSRVTTDVTVTATAVESLDRDKAVVLVAATSRVTNSAGAKQEPRSWRLSVNLQREGDQIKMSKVEFVP